jgi:uncharacterized protein (TIRG00374 family)
MMKSILSWFTQKGFHHLLPRLIGVTLFGWLLTRFDVSQVVDSLFGARIFLVFLTMILIIPLIVLKAFRWKAFLRTQSIFVNIWRGSLAYFSSMFLGFLTPGRLGEFSRVIYLKNRHDISSGRALSSVLVDRFFDLYATLLIGAFALIIHSHDFYQYLTLVLFGVVLSVLLVVLGSKSLFDWFAQIGLKLGVLGRKLFADESWLHELSVGMRQLNLRVLLFSLAVTVVAYALYFFQCYLLATALQLEVGFFPIMFAVSLGGLVTLLPISILGLGTREATIVAYLGAFGVSGTDALSFSLLVFTTP